MSRFLASLCLVIAFIVTSITAHAQMSDAEASALEDRARAVGTQLRCVVCQNQSIEESDAELAADMRRMVRESLQAGDSEAEVIEQMRVRYGDFVLLKPPVQLNTLILWVGPFVLIGVLLIWWAISVRKRSTVRGDIPPVSAEDRERLNALRGEAKFK